MTDGPFRMSIRTLRRLVRHPGFALPVILMLTLGIGGSTAMFSVIYSSWLKPLPFRDAGRLVRIFEFEKDHNYPTSTGNYLDLADRTRGLEGLAAHTSSGFLLSGETEAGMVPAASVTPNFFAVMGSAPILGRGFTPEDGEPGAERVVVLSHGLWRDRFGGDPGVIGKTVRLYGVPHTVVGVTSPDFYFRRSPYGTTNAQLFVPFRWAPDQRERGFGRWLFPVGRKAPGTTTAAAQRELRGIFAQLDPDQTASPGGEGATLNVVDFRDWELGEDHTALLLFGAAAGLVLLIACVNVLILLLARYESRLREFGVRAALGAGRARLISSFMGEAVMLALLGGLAGILLASWSVDGLAVLFGTDLPRGGQIALHGPVLLFALALALVAGLTLGLLAAFQLTPRRMIDHLRRAHAGSVKGRSRLRSGLVVGQFALTLVLVAGAGLLMNSFWRLTRVDLGIDVDRALVFDISLPGARYQERASIDAYYRSLLAELVGLPQVREAGLVDPPPFETRMSTSLSPANNPEVESPDIFFRATTPDFFRAAGIPLLAGRVFQGSVGQTLAEGEREPVILSQSAAGALFPQADAVGERILYHDRELEVIGVVGDVREFGAARPQTPALYQLARTPSRSMSVLLRATSGIDPAALVPLARGVVARLDPEVSVFDINTLEQKAAGRIEGRRSTLSLVVAFAMVALILASLGVYGVLAYMVARRTREIGVRLALGAEPARLVKEVLRRGLVLAGLGLAIGMAGAIAFGRLLRGMLWEISPTDPTTLALVTLLLFAAALTACYVPARRAASVDPLVALREE